MREKIRNPNDEPNPNDQSPKRRGGFSVSISGFEFDSSFGFRHSGFRASNKPFSYDLEAIRDSTRPFHLHFFPRLRSTNDHAAAMRRQARLFAPAMVLTGKQIAGRGRGSHAWWSGKGCITVTFALPIDEQLAPHQIPLLAGLAVRQAAAEITGSDRLQLKWPNDLVFNSRKVGGLLCERIQKIDLVGLGLNVNFWKGEPPRALAGSVTSLSEISGRLLDLTEVLSIVTRHLQHMMVRQQEQSFASLLREYDDHHALIGRRVRVLNGDNSTISGTCEGLDSMGRLLLRSRSKLHHVISGQVTVR
jgi:BirA family biotin operon repressor/biotin-[acetyl-CoA-carboxylase] ligase